MLDKGRSLHRGRLSLYKLEYVEQLNKAWGVLLGYFSSVGICVQSLAESPKPWDTALEQFVQFAWQSEFIKLGTVIRAILAVQKKGKFHKAQLNVAWGLAWRWRVHQPIVRRPPLPDTIFQAVVFGLLSMAAAAPWASQCLIYGGALTIWCGYRMLLRPSEMLLLCRSTLHLACDFGADGLHFCIAKLENTKTTRAFGFTQMSYINDPLLHQWLSWFLARTPKHRKLWPLTLVALCRLFRQGLEMLGIPGETFSLGSLRAGGTTKAFLESGDLNRLQFQGRWKNSATMYHYIQTGLACLGEAALSAESAALVSEGARFFARSPSPPLHLKPWA